MSKQHYCSRCGDPLDDPDTEATYVKADDLVSTDTVEVAYALKLNDRLRTIRDQMVEERGLNVTQANRAMARMDGDYIPEEASVSKSDFDRQEVTSPIQPEDDPEVVQTVREFEEREVANTGLVCQDCRKPTDFVMWDRPGLPPERPDPDTTDDA